MYLAVTLKIITDKEYIATNIFKNKNKERVCGVAVHYKPEVRRFDSRRDH
jgi:hypothetical protein